MQEVARNSHIPPVAIVFCYLKKMRFFEYIKMVFFADNDASKM